MDPYLVVLGPRHMVLGMYLRLAFHGLRLIVAYIYCALIVCWALAVNHLLILIVTLGGRWWCDSYFIDEKTRVGRLIDWFKVTRPVSD